MESKPANALWLVWGSGESSHHSSAAEKTFCLFPGYLETSFFEADFAQPDMILHSLSGNSEGFHIMHSYALRSPVAGIMLPVSIEVTTITNNRFVLIGYTIR